MATRHGKIVGVVQEKIPYLAVIPYAAPPTELRWRAPQPVTAAGCAPGGLFLLRQLAGYYGVAAFGGGVREIFGAVSI